MSIAKNCADSSPKLSSRGIPEAKLEKAAHIAASFHLGITPPIPLYRSPYAHNFIVHCCIGRALEKSVAHLDPCNQVDSSELFTQASRVEWKWLNFDDLKGMVSASEAALTYLRSVEDSTANHAGLFHDIGITIADVENSLELITATYPNKDTLNSTAWWEEHGAMVVEPSRTTLCEHVRSQLNTAHQICNL